VALSELTLAAESIVWLPLEQGDHPHVSGLHESAKVIAWWKLWWHAKMDRQPWLAEGFRWR
jgi:hypothetical protein